MIQSTNNKVLPEDIADFMHKNEQTTDNCRTLLALLRKADKKEIFKAKIGAVNILGKIIEINVSKKHPAKEMFISCLSSINPRLWFEIMRTPSLNSFQIIVAPLWITNASNNEEWTKAILNQTTTAAYLKYLSSVDLSAALGAVESIKKENRIDCYQTLASVNLYAALSYTKAIFKNIESTPNIKTDTIEQLWQSLHQCLVSASHMIVER